MNDDDDDDDDLTNFSVFHIMSAACKKSRRLTKNLLPKMFDYIGWNIALNKTKSRKYLDARIIFLSHGLANSLK